MQFKFVICFAKSKVGPHYKINRAFFLSCHRFFVHFFFASSTNFIFIASFDQRVTGIFPCWQSRTCNKYINKHITASIEISNGGQWNTISPACHCFLCHIYVASGDCFVWFHFEHAKHWNRSVWLDWSIEGTWRITFCRHRMYTSIYGIHLSVYHYHLFCHV